METLRRDIDHAGVYFVILPAGDARVHDSQQVLGTLQAPWDSADVSGLDVRSAKLSGRVPR